MHELIATGVVLCLCLTEGEASTCTQQPAVGDTLYTYENRCFYNHPYGLSFTQAMRYCNRNYDNGRMVHLENNETMMAIFTPLNKIGWGNSPIWWIGLKEYNSKWHWLNADFSVTCGKNMENVNWLRARYTYGSAGGALKGLPNNGFEIGWEAGIARQACHSQNHFLCEVPVTEAQTQANSDEATNLSALGAIPVLVSCAALIGVMVKWNDIKEKISGFQKFI